MLKYDDYAFEQTARAVYLMNDSAREIYDNADELMEFMYSMARLYQDGCGHFGTGGFVLTFTTQAPDNTRYVTASVNSYVALKYAESVNDRMNHIAALAA
jgi:hypothetical protein